MRLFKRRRRTRERLEDAVGVIGDAIVLLDGYRDGDAVDARALLEAALVRLDRP